ncbi:MAG: DinB family protein [Acidobacteria bacterium]|nr:DinB family protein [Acidobacteriota bacterium]
MNTFFDEASRVRLVERLQKIDVQTGALWGRMSAAQMLAHCTATMQMPVGDLQVKRSFLSLIGWMFKGMIHSDKPFSKSSPTAPEFVIHDERNFETEKKRFTDAFQKLTQGPATITCHDHPFFGKMTSHDWGRLVYKHLDHHLRQFGA